MELTLSIIKPDAVANDAIGKIYARFEEAGFKIVAAKMMHLDRELATDFYTIHKTRHFFKDLIDFMTSGPIMVQVLEAENAVIRHRQIMGSTNPQEAYCGTIRANFAGSVQENAVHGSDSVENAINEINYFFSKDEVYKRTR